LNYDLHFKESFLKLLSLSFTQKLKNLLANGFIYILVLAPASPPGPVGPKTLKAEGNIFENCLQSNGCTAGCKLNRAGPDTSAIFDKCIF